MVLWNTTGNPSTVPREHFGKTRLYTEHAYTKRKLFVLVNVFLSVGDKIDDFETLKICSYFIGLEIINVGRVHITITLAVLFVYCVFFFISDGKILPDDNQTDTGDISPKLQITITTRIFCAVLGVTCIKSFHFRSL